jgi:hypothetical protein
MRCFHDEFCRLYGVSDSFEADHAARFQCFTLHEGRIEPSDAVKLQYAAQTGIEESRILHDGYRPNYSVERGPASWQEFLPCYQTFRQLSQSFLRGSSVACPAVHDQKHGPSPLSMIISHATEIAELDQQ